MMDLEGLQEEIAVALFNGVGRRVAARHLIAGSSPELIKQIQDETWAESTPQSKIKYHKAASSALKEMFGDTIHYPEGWVGHNK